MGSRRVSWHAAGALVVMALLLGRVGGGTAVGPGAAVGPVVYVMPIHGAIDLVPYSQRVARLGRIR